MIIVNFFYPGFHCKFAWACHEQKIRLVMKNIKTHITYTNFISNIKTKFEKFTQVAISRNVAESNTNCTPKSYSLTIKICFINWIINVTQGVRPMQSPKAA